LRIFSVSVSVAIYHFTRSDGINYKPNIISLFSLAQPVGWCNRSNCRYSCEPHFSKGQSVSIGRLRVPCAAKRSLEMEEEIYWSQISRSDQRSYSKIEILRGKNSTEIHNALHEVCGYSVVDRSTVSQWASRFREGRVSFQDDLRSGRPVTATDDTSVVIVSTLLEEDRRKSCEETAHEANRSTASVFRIVTQTLQMRKVVAKWVPHQLSEEHKTARKRVAEDLLQRYEAESEQFLNRTVAIDEAWIRDFDPQLKSQSSQWKHATSPRPKKFRRQQSKVKFMMIMAYDKNGMIATDRVPPGSAVTAAYYRKFLQDVLRIKIRQKQVNHFRSRCPHFAR